MSSISIICLSGFLILFLSLFKKGTDIFSPARLFLLVWLLAIGLTDLKLSRYQQEWSTFSWIMLILPLVSMLSGIFIAYVINFNKKLLSIIHVRDLIRRQYIDENLFLKFIIILFIAYLISYIISYIFIGYIPLFTPIPDVVRTTWGIFGFGLFVQSIPAIIFLIIIFLLFNKNRKSKLLITFVLVVSFVTYSFLLQRYYIMMPLIISVVLMYYGTWKLKPKNLIIVFLILVGIMYGISSIRVSRYAISFIYLISQMKYGVDYAMITEPYMYIVMNLENYTHAVNRLQEFSYGVYSFDFIFALSGLKYPLRDYMSLIEYPHLITNTYNTYTMFFIYYRDFGILGVGFIPFVIGFILSSIYYYMKLNPSIKSISLYSLCTFVIIFSFFVPIITFLHFIFNLAIIYIVTSICLDPNNIQSV